MFHAVTTDDTRITNLIHLYAELLDSGQLEACCDLFAHARVVLDHEADPPVVVDRDGLLEVWQSMVAIHEDGTPRTRHLVGTPILEVDAEAGTATCRSTYTVFQQVAAGPLQPIISGRYNDRFERVDGTWRFTERIYAADLVGAGVLGTDLSVDIVLHWGAGAYIVGEETALIESLEGNRGMPRLKPPYFPAAIGLYGRPTIVNNVETLANLPWIMEHGAEAYRGFGSEASPGTRLFSLSGHVRRPGVYEVEQGVTTFRDLIYGDDFCQGIRDGHELKMFIPGGGSAPWFFNEHLNLPLEARPVGAAGSMLGSGAIVVMDETTDAVKACLRLVRFFANESCGKCTPCREGTSWEEKILQRIYDGHGRPSDIDLLLDVGDNISPGPYPVAAHTAEGLEVVPFPPRQTTICPLGPSSVAPIVSTIRRFRHEFEAKITRGDTIPVSAAPATAAPATAAPVTAGGAGS
mgnify:CR=1 FL=1